MIQRIRKLILGAVSLLVISAVLISAVRDPDLHFLIKKNFTIFSEVYREVSLNYVEEVNPEKLIRKGMDAMLKSLDPYTVFIGEDQNQDLEIMTRGSYGGIGLHVGIKSNEIVVISSMEGYSAFNKGVRPGDIVRAVNGISTEGMNPDEVQNMTVGEPGTTVSLTIERYGMEQDITFELERQQIEVKNVAYSGVTGPESNIGYILINRFGQATATEVQETLSELKSEKKLNGLILDLRNNPGGLLEEAVGVVDKFIEPGQLVVETRGRLNQHNNSFHTKEPVMSNLPVVILQNSGSASASEIVSGALQDYDRAVIVGEQSFGKGVVQIIKPLSYNTSLKITTSKYIIPSGRSIQSEGYTQPGAVNNNDRANSVQKAFKTKNGRTVFDGQGIRPDVFLESEAPDRLETALRQQNFIFQFANKYSSEYEEYTAAELSDELFNEFKTYLRENKFAYKTKAERHLEELEKSLSGEGKNLESEIKELRKALEIEKEQHFSEQSSKIKEILNLELISRYEGKRAQIRASLKYDDMVKKAVDLLNTPEKYNYILSKN